MNLNFKQLETFIWVADLGSFRGAAERLFTTQPNISSRIASLESALNTKLMERDAGSVRLTTRGVQLLGHARNVLRTMEDFIEAADESALFDDVLHLGVTEMVGQTWLRDFLRLFKSRFPNVQIELTIDLSVNLERELENRVFDITFQSGPFTRHSTGSVSLGSFSTIWVGSPEIKLHKPKNISAEDLIKYPILTHSRNTRTYQEMTRHFSELPGGKVRLIPSSSLSVCRQMTLDGYGVSALLLPIVKKDIENGLLHKLNYKWTPEPLEFFARYDLNKSSKIVKLAASLASEISNDFSVMYSQ